MLRHKSQMSRMRKGSPQYNTVRRRALQCLKQRKMYEGQLEQAQNIDFNMSSMRSVRGGVGGAGGRGGPFSEEGAALPPEQRFVELRLLAPQQDSGE
eukprot:SAG11_NODE_17280_length_523_cov_0.849057_1_plen_96_part_10